MLKLKRYPYHHSAIVLFVICALPASAIELPWGSRLNGFAQQTSMWSDNNDFVSDTDDQVAIDIVDLGLTLNHTFTDTLQFSGQLNSHQAGDTGNGEVKVDYAYGQWSAIQADNSQLNLQAGTVILKYGLYNGLRDVAFSRPNIFMPYSVYYDRFRQSVFSHDGIASDYRYHLGFDSIRIESAYAVPRSNPSEIDEIVPDGIFKNGHASGQEAYSARFTYEQPLQARYAFSAIYLRWDFDADLITGNDAQPLIPIRGGFNISSIGASLEQHYSELKFVTEVFRHHLGYDNLFAGEDLELDINAAYIQLISPCGSFQCLTQIEWFKTVNNDHIESNFTRDIALGISWRALARLDIRFEGHHVYGQSWLRNFGGGTHTNWHYLALQFAWSF